MNTQNLYAGKTLVRFFDAFFASIGLAHVFLLVLEFLPIGVYNYSLPILQFTYWDFIFVFIAIFYVLYSSYRNTHHSFDEQKAHAYLLAIIRYTVAAGISTYGFAKILGGQMPAPAPTIHDAKISDLTEAWLTFYYFGLSRPYTMFIALIEILGPVLLLFRRTTLLGVFILLPAMINIFLLNVFYKIGLGAMVNSLFFSTALVYLLSLHWQIIKRIFSGTEYSLPKLTSLSLKTILRFCVLLLAFMVTYQWHLRFPENYQKADGNLLGKWKVEHRYVNGVLNEENAWQTDENIWSTLYFINARQFAFSNNPYYYTSRTGGVSGEYFFDHRNKRLELYLFQPKDTLKANIIYMKEDSLELEGTLRQDTIRLNLRKVKEVKT